MLVGVVLLIFNVLVIFQKVSPVLSGLYSLGFLLFIPGLMTVIAMKLKNIDVEEKILVTVGVSLSFLMFGGLLLNILYPIFGAPTPLSKLALLSLVDIYVLITSLLISRRYTTFNFSIKRTPFRFIVVSLIPLVLVLQAYIGASVLNNMGSNSVALSLLGEIGIYFFCLTYFRKKVPAWLIPWSIFWISYALILMSSLRSSYVIGSDISEEFKAAQIVLSQGYWKFIDYRSIYNACLSITILPAEISKLSGISLGTIFKVVMPLIASAVPLTIYITFKRYSKFAAMLGSLFFISFPAFFVTLSQHSRQAVALYFFALCIMLFFIKISSRQKKILFILFALSMVVSHYSVAYLAVVIFGIAYLLEKFRKELLGKKLQLSGASPLTGASLLVVFLFSFLWYSQVTLNSSTLNDFLSKSVKNIGNSLSSDNKADRATIFDQFNVTYNTDPQQDLNQAASSAPPVAGNLAGPSSDQEVSYAAPSSVTGSLSGIYFQSVYYFGEVLKRVLQLFIPLGVVFLYIRMRGKPYVDQYIWLSLGAAIAVVAVLVVPYASIYYSFERAYIQSNIVLAPLSVLGAIGLLSIINRKFAHTLTIVMFILYYLYYSGLTSVLVGSSSPYTSLYNAGESYGSQYVFSSEVDAARWISMQWEPQDQLLADDGNSSKVLAYAGSITQVQSKLIIPSQINKTSYVFSGASNNTSGIGYVSAKGGIVGYTFPTYFLAQNKNTVYNNGSVKIYK